MSLMIVRATQSSAPEQSPAEIVLDSMGLTEQLPEQVTQNASGQPFEPVQLNQSQDVLPQLALVLRREPVGGAESQIHDNQRRMREQLLTQINRALASAGMRPRDLLQPLIEELEVRKEALEQRSRNVEQTYTRIQERLHRWQDHAAQRSGSLTEDLWRWLVGGRDRLSIPEVIALWNEREHQALQRAALRAALELFTSFLGTLLALLQDLDRHVAEARLAYTTLSQGLEQLQHASYPFAPLTLKLEPQVAIKPLLAQADPELLITSLLRQQHDAGRGTALLELLLPLVQQEVARRLEPITLVDLIELEMQANSGETDDPLLLVGESLLATLQQPTWQLVRGARPRTELVQITPDGTPLYSLDGASSAAYGAADRMGFIQIQLGVAKEDLALVRDTDETFQATLRQRNLYVLEELALAAGSTQHQVEVQTEASTNGTLVQEA